MRQSDVFRSRVDVFRSRESLFDGTLGLSERRANLFGSPLSVRVSREAVAVVCKARRQAETSAAVTP